MKLTTSDDFLVMSMHQATPMLTEDRVQECIDPKLGNQYPLAGALKVALLPFELLVLWLCYPSNFLFCAVGL
jgi:hypothetical protein